MRKELAPWMKRWIGLDPDEIRRTLSREWASIRYPSVARFRDVILSFRPFAIAHDGYRWYLGLNRADDGEDDRTIYIEAPLDPVVLDECLSNHGAGGHDLMREFYTHFHGVRNRPVFAGNFERPEEWQRFQDLHWEEDRMDEEFKSTIIKWYDALILYTTSTGDMVLRNADDQIVWLSHEEDLIVSFAP